jgi:hypothetical protein
MIGAGVIAFVPPQKAGSGSELGIVLVMSLFFCFQSLTYFSVIDIGLDPAAI